MIQPYRIQKHDDPFPKKSPHHVTIALPALIVLIVIFVTLLCDTTENEGVQPSSARNNNTSYSEKEPIESAIPSCDDTLYSTTSVENQVVPEDDWAVAETYEETLPKIMSVDTETDIRFYRMQLNDTDKQMYDRIVLSILSHQPGLDHIHNYDLYQIFDLYELVLRDYPEFFWIDSHVSGTTYTGIDNYCNLQYNYVYSAEEATELVDRITQETDEYVQSLANLSEYEKVKSTYEYLISQTSYDDTVDDQTLLSVILDHQGVCASYSRSMQYLLNRLGIQSLFVEGVSTNSSGITANHSWNVVRIENEYYHVDVTWGDPLPEEGELEICRHDYLNVTTEEILRSRSINPDFYIPLCDSVRFNYFVQEQRIFDYLDEDRLMELFYNSVLSGEGCEIKFSDSSVFDNAVYALFDEPNEMNNYLTRINDNLETDCHTVWYKLDTTMCCIQIWFAG